MFICRTFGVCRAGRGNRPCGGKKQPEPHARRRRDNACGFLYEFKHKIKRLHERNLSAFGQKMERNRNVGKLRKQFVRFLVHGRNKRTSFRQLYTGCRLGRRRKDLERSIYDNRSYKFHKRGSSGIFCKRCGGSSALLFDIAGI